MLVYRKLLSCSDKLSKTIDSVQQDDASKKEQFALYEKSRSKSRVWQKQWWKLRFNDPRSALAVLTTAEIDTLIALDRTVDLLKTVEFYPLCERPNVRKDYYVCANRGMRRVENALGDLKEVLSFQKMLQSSDCTKVYLEEAKLRWLKG